MLIERRVLIIRQWRIQYLEVLIHYIRRECRSFIELFKEFKNFQSTVFISKKGNIHHQNYGLKIKTAERDLGIIIKELMKDDQGGNKAIIVNETEFYKWKIERLFAWLQNFRRIVVRYEYHSDNYLGFVLLGYMLIWLRNFFWDSFEQKLSNI